MKPVKVPMKKKRPHRKDKSFDADRYTTPAVGLAPALHYFGEFDLDPCWDPDSLVKALYRVDIRTGQSGLTYDWTGCALKDITVWLNPPYSCIKPWTKYVQEMLDHALLQGIGMQVLALLPANTDTVWWHEHVFESEYTRRVMYRRGRLNFLKRGVPDKQPRGANAYVLWSNESMTTTESKRFDKAFEGLGHIAKFR